MPICHCAMVNNLLCSEVNCPEVVFKKLQEGGEWKKMCFFFLPLFFFFRLLAQKCLIHMILRGNGGRHLVLNSMQICGMQLPKTISRRCSKQRGSDL